MNSREYDVVVWGASGFTGRWVAKHLYDHYSDGSLKWAIAGRNSAKLAQVREFIGDADDTVPQLIGDSNDEASLQALVRSTKVIITTVGPYAYYGSALVKACVNAGTHYVDLTGEVPWIRTMIDQHQETAKQNQAHIVHCCGFDSIPSDMGNYFTQQQAKESLGAYLKNVRYTILKAKGGISGGTVASLINVIKEAVRDKNVRRVLANPYSLNPDPTFRGNDKPDQSGVEYSKELDLWTAPFIMAGINTRIVRRSNALMGFTYGEDFSYSESMATSKGAAGYVAAKTISTGIKAIAFTSITAAGRTVLGWLLPSQGEGPKVDPDNPGFYRIQFNGETADGRSFATRVSGDSDPGYGSTSKMLAEAGVCLAKDELNSDYGFGTTASTMGDALLVRLQDNAGLSFEVID